MKVLKGIPVILYFIFLICKINGFVTPYSNRQSLKVEDPNSLRRSFVSFTLSSVTDSRKVEPQAVKDVLDALFPKDTQDQGTSPQLAVASSSERYSIGRNAQGFSEGNVMTGWVSGDMTYGEYDFDFFCELVNLARSELPEHKQKGSNFLEIGSGCGRLTFAASLLWEWNKCTGVEIVESLHQLALKAQKALQKEDNFSLKSGANFLCSDAHSESCGIEDADIIFSYCSTFSSFGNELTAMSATLGSKAQAGSVIITTDKVLSNDGPWQFELLHTCVGINKETAGKSTAYMWKVSSSIAY